MRMLPTQRTLVDQVYGELLAAITDGQLRPNERLIQDELAAKLGVSRQPVQQALLLLRNDGLVTSAAGRGLVVASVDAEKARQLYEIRAVIEGLAARLSTEHGGERARIPGAEIVAAGRAAVAAGSVARMIKADLELHRLLYALSGNPLIAQTTEPHWRHMGRIMGEVLTGSDMPDRIWDQHEAIIAAVVAGDAARAERLSRQHITEAAVLFLDRLGTGTASSMLETLR
ncbi:MAG: GntR family transcriptional regulator [Janthinobacterium lividum]